MPSLQPGVIPNAALRVSADRSCLTAQWRPEAQGKFTRQYATARVEAQNRQLLSPHHTYSGRIASFAS
jgi:hypothetical protein